MTSDTSRERVKRRFAVSGAEYDSTRFGHPRGELLSEADAKLFLRMLPAPNASMRVLEVGAGTGRFTTLALEHGFTLTATDVNRTLLETLGEKIRRMGAEDRCRVRLEDLFQLTSPDGKYDLVYSINVIPRLESLDDQRAAIREIARTLRPGGHFLFNYRNSRSPYRIRFKGHTTSPEEIDSALVAGDLRIVDMRGRLLSSAKLFRRLPMFVNRLIVGLDLALSRYMTYRAWDVFILAQKD